MNDDIDPEIQDGCGIAVKHPPHVVHLKAFKYGCTGRATPRTEGDPSGRCDCQDSWCPDHDQPSPVHTADFSRLVTTTDEARHDYYEALGDNA